MNISAPIINYNVSATATAARAGSSSATTLLQSTATNIPADADVAYTAHALIAKGYTLSLLLNNGNMSPAGVWTTPVRQQEKIVASGTITGAGLATVSVTTDGGLPYAVDFDVELNDTATVWAEKCRVALAADDTIDALYDVGGGTGTNIILTRKPFATYTLGGVTTEMAVANDATCAISITNNTCTGITSGASTNFVAGVEGAGILLYNDQVDFEGITLPAMTDVYGLLIEHSTNDPNGHTVDYTIGTEYSGRMTSTTDKSSAVLLSYPDTASIIDTLAITSTTDTGVVSITVIAKV